MIFALGPNSLKSWRRDSIERHPPLCIQNESASFSITAETNEVRSVCRRRSRSDNQSQRTVSFGPDPCDRTCPGRGTDVAIKGHVAGVIEHSRIEIRKARA